MHYIRFNGTKEQEHGDFEEIVRYADKSGAVGIVTELRNDLIEIDEATYATEKAAILAYNEALPEPEPPAPTPTLGEALAPEMAGLTAAITELRDALGTDPAAKAAAEKMAAHTGKMKQVLERT